MSVRSTPNCRARAATRAGCRVQQPRRPTRSIPAPARTNGARPRPRCSGSAPACAQRTSMTETLLGVAGPVFTVGGQTVGALARDCVRLVVDEGVDGLRTLEAQFVATGVGAPGPPG